MQKFAKLFETQEHGQILVKLDSGDDGAPELRYYFAPEGLGVCSMAINGKDTDKGWSAMAQVFDEQTSETASEVVADLKRQMGI
ncbi:hypothetical protein F6V30_14085 [Oryzomonas sagensis]|uniref:Uncharacterized protein n=1 Tax=Oryzomonas sagensis TaxID=2603857 RepID=A0ABQ6TL17_9BACT|nr:hypothetical protein [Oryzomonas sagensis]KAB0668963.1 hypothetical protein F6V30_14085 [Oryzomonas sagensis]